jgi:hypothetical protein
MPTHEAQADEDVEQRIGLAAPSWLLARLGSAEGRAPRRR